MPDKKISHVECVLYIFNQITLHENHDPLNRDHRNSSHLKRMLQEM